MTRSDPLAAYPFHPRHLTMAAIAVATVVFAGCGGGGGAGDPVVDGVTASPQAAGSQSTSTAPTATSLAGGEASNGAPAGAAANAAATMAPARLASFGYYRLGSPGAAGTASVRADTLSVDGRQSSNASLVAGACNGGSAFNQCASAAGANVFTLCSSDGGGGSNTDRIRSRYVLFDPAAERITDASVLRNISFSGFENCGQDNVGAQPKSAPSANLRFSATGDLTLVRYDQDPARTSTLPAFYVNLNGDTVSGGQTARFNVYRSNGRYLIIATSVPTAGVTAANPGTLIAFVQN